MPPMTPANDNTASSKFTVGRTYRCRSICDYECIFSFMVISRTAQWVTITHHGKPVRRKVRLVNGVEHIDPHGRYSMSPVLAASDLAKVG
jgi:hypothetical protein